MLKMELPYDSAILLLVIYLKKSKNIDLKRSCTLENNTYTLVFITALFIIAKIWKQPLCLSTDEWINRCGMHTHTMEYYSVIKRMKCCHVQQHEYTWSVSAKTYSGWQIGYHLYVESKKYNKWVCVAQWYWLTLCNPTDCSPPGSSLHGIFQTRILEGCHFLLQGIFPTVGSNLCLLH